MRRIGLLVGILFVATLLRFYNLATLPPSLEWDEVATGYDAYSILKTGKDQYGNFLPLTIRSLDDYKPPLYTYLTVGSIAVFGWNDFAVRFPAALLGVLAVFTTYGLTRKLLGNDKLALLAALLLAISPWHVNFSRLALETNSTIFFTTAAAWAFLVGLEVGPLLLLSAMLFGLDLYLYHNARVFVPVFGLVLLILYGRDLWKQRFYTVGAGILLAIFLIRLIPIVTSVEGTMRFQGTSIFSEAEETDFTPIRENYARWRLIDINTGIGIYGRLFHNQYVLYGLQLVKNYLTHFDPNFWIFTNDYPRHHMPEMGVIYFVELPLIFIGFFYLFLLKNRRAIIFLFSWLLIAPLPAAVTRDVPHALRVEIMLPIFQILVALAIWQLYQLFKERNLRKFAFITIVAVAYFFSVSFFLHKFLFHYARETSQYWQYGRKEAAEFADSIKDQYDRVLVSTQLDQPHMFFLYYLRYDPKIYQASGGTFSGGWAEERNQFDKYEFKSFDYAQMKNGKLLFIGLPEEFPKDLTPLKKIYYLDGTEAIWITS